MIKKCPRFFHRPNNSAADLLGMVSESGAVSVLGRVRFRGGVRGVVRINIRVSARGGQCEGWSV